MSGAPPFELRRGRVALGSFIVLDEVDFRLGPGEFVVLLGANGSGKTTLVRALLGVVPLAGGTLRIFGAAPGDFGGWQRIGYVPQRFTASAGVPATVGEVVLSGRVGHVAPLRRYGPRDREAARRAIEVVDLADDARRPVGALSGGQQQRVLIARALAAEPEVLVLDEPVSGVDADTQASFAATLERLHSTGRSVLLVAHHLGALMPLVGRAVVLESGRVAYDGPPRKLDLPAVEVHHHGAAQHRLDRAPGRAR
jgi:zinc transport system ATP-binding protein